MNRAWAVYIAYFSSSLIIALALTPLVRPLALRLGAIDHGSGRRVHKGIVPRLGGLAIFAAFVLPLAFSLTRGDFDSFHWRLSGILLASILVFIIGIFDDFRRASIWMRLLVEAAAALFVYFWGIRITAFSNPFGGTFDLGWLSLPVTVAWIVIITNAVNLIDGLDGLAAGTGLLIAATLLILGFPRDMHINLVFIMLIGALSGFLVYNFPPASIFMGDSGSLFLGFFLAAFSIVSSSKAQALATMMIPLIAFSLPLLDMAYAVLRRYYRGIPLGKPDREHIHHKLLERGLGTKKTVIILYLVNGGLMAFILLFVSANIDLNYLVLIGIFAMAVIGLRILGYLQFRAFFQDTLRNLRVSRKRRYIHYLIRRFRRECEHECTPSTLRRALDALFSEYGLERVTIQVAEGSPPLVLFSSGRSFSEGEALELAFPGPALRPGGTLVKLTKRADDEGFLCSAELMLSLKAVLPENINEIR